MSKKLPKENLKKVSGGVTSKNVTSSKDAKKNVLDTDVNTSKAPDKKNPKNFPPPTSQTCSPAGCGP